MTDQGRGYPHRLRLITYLAPGIPIEYFEMLKEYLEEKLQCYAYLISESRWSGPPEDRIDPFTTGDADIGFACAPTCQRMFSKPSCQAALLGVAPVYINQHSNGLPVYYTEVVVNKENCDRFKQFEDLRGSSWAYNDDYSMSGCLITQQELQKIGENDNFFGKIIKSGSHQNSIQMVIDKTVDGAGIDSNTLAFQMMTHPDLRDRLHVVATWGPMPVYPVLVSSQLREDLKKSIATHLLNMHQEPRWQAELNRYMVSKFVPITTDHFLELEKLKGQVTDTTTEM